MKNQTLIILALAAGLGYYFYTQKKKGKESTEPSEPADNEAPPPPKSRELPPLPKTIIPYAYNPDTTIKPVAVTLDRLQSIFKPAVNVPFTLNPSAKKVKKAAVQKKAAKRKKLGELGAGYLYV
jgi:hypothetical protein